MEDKKEKQEEVKVASVASAAATGSEQRSAEDGSARSADQSRKGSFFAGRSGGIGARGGKDGSRGGAAGGDRGSAGSKRRGSDRGARPERAKPEFDQKIINIRRVTRVVSGGRRFAFSVAIVAGNRNGKVGVGIGKSTDTSLAIEKAFKNAKKNMVEVKRNKDKSIPHEAYAKYCTSEVMVKPAVGKGIVAGSSVRNVLDLAGITDVSSKILSRSKNKLNIAQATILALKQFAD